MPDTRRKFLEWLANRAPEKKGEHGHASAVAEEVGLSQPFVSRMLNAWKAGDNEKRGDVSLTTLDTIAETVGKDATWELVKEIEESSTARTVIPIDHQIVRKWRALFRRNPRRGQRVLDNLKLQEDLGYTDAISRMVRAIIELGPDQAIPAVVDEVVTLGKDETREIRSKRLRAARDLAKQKNA